MATLSVKVHGQEYSVRLEDCTAKDVSDCRRETGVSLQDVFGQISSSPDLDSVAALVWLARRQSGERELSFRAVALTINYGTEIEIVGDEEDEPEGE